MEHRIELIRTLERRPLVQRLHRLQPQPHHCGTARSFPEKVVLIAGGKDKGISYAPLGPVVNDHVKLLLLCGATAGVIREAVEQAENYARAGDLGRVGLPSGGGSWPMKLAAAGGRGDSLSGQHIL